MSAEMRRGSVGNAYSLHNRKSSLLADRPISYIGRGAGAGAVDMEKRVATANAVVAAHGLPLMKVRKFKVSLCGQLLIKKNILRIK